ncbi:MAG TPA: NUDIX domain-containing protein [Vineibacter sp.]|nr:NUDIX domain-containing protein [Vineibacter sp.]
MATHKNGLAVSVKGVVLVERRVLLLRNERDEWELPGGRPEPGESWPEALARELREEADIDVAVGPLLAEWRYEVLPQRFVWIAAFGCWPNGTAVLRVSVEHQELRLVDPGELDGLKLPAGYRAVIDGWYQR